MDRNEILANFQACTGIEDIGKCITILDQHNWDLQVAVTANLEGQQSTSVVVSNGASAYQPHNNGQTPTMLTFSCTLGEMTKDVTLDDSSTVGDLKEIAAIELRIPQSEVQFERWPPESTITKPSDNIVLRLLCLPHYNTMNVKTQSPLPGVSIGLDTSDNNPFDLPCIALNHVPEAVVIDNIKKSYMLKVTNRDDESKHDVQMEGIKTFANLKDVVASKTGIDFNKQEWDGFPGGYPPDETSTLGSLQLNHPSHNLFVKTFSTVVHPYTSNSPSTSYPFDLSSHAFAALRPTSKESSSDDEYNDVGLDDEDIFNTNTVTSSTIQELMPGNVEDTKGALLQFQHEFYTRYGEGPQFIADELQVAVQKAFGPEARKRKLLAVYIHHDRSIQSNVFCSQLLCNESISSYLNENFVCWAWDVTSQSNKTRFLQSCTQYMGSGVTETIKKLKKDEYPVLILAQGKGRSCDVTAIIQGNSELNELMAKLIKAVDDAEEQRLLDIREEDARSARERIKLEQEEAYRESLAADRAKMLAEKEEIKRKEEEARLKKEEEDLEQEKADKLRNNLPPEPSADCGLPISQVRFRAPDGATFMRSFLASESLQTLVDFVGSRGYSSSQYRILKPWPKTNLLDLDLTSSLKEHKIFPQETLIIEEKPDFDS